MIHSLHSLTLGSTREPIPDYQGRWCVLQLHLVEVFFLSLMIVLVSAAIIHTHCKYFRKVFVHAAGMGDFLKAQKTVRLLYMPGALFVPFPSFLLYLATILSATTFVILGATN